jgi:hypothetical protein
VDNTFGFICQNSNNITAYYDFYNTATNPGTLLFTKNVTFPIGYLVTFNGNGIGSNFTVDYDTPFDCIFNASICAGAGNLPIVNQTCTGDSCIIPTGANVGLLSGFDQLGGILSPFTILLGAVLAFGAVTIQNTGSTPMGLIVVLAGTLILSFYNVVPWYITVLITIVAGFFILTEVRKGVFGNAVVTG